MMKVIKLWLMIMVSGSGFALSQSDTVNSQVFRWNELKVDKTMSGESRPIVRGTTTTLANLEIRAVTLQPNKSAPSVSIPNSVEELIIIKAGKLTIAIGDNSKVLGAGSVALFLPGEDRTLKNTSDATTTYYEFICTSKAPVDMKRGKEAGGSIMVDWNEVEFQETDVGGRRQILDRPTAMLSRFEMHVTTLNESLASHQAHTHPAEEFVLMRKSEVEMLIGETNHVASEGDLIFLASQLQHGLNNTGKGQTEYFAFQWQ